MTIADTTARYERLDVIKQLIRDREGPYGSWDAKRAELIALADEAAVIRRELLAALLIGGLTDADRYCRLAER